MTNQQNNQSDKCEECEHNKCWQDHRGCTHFCHQPKPQECPKFAEHDHRNCLNKEPQAPENWEVEWEKIVNRMCAKFPLSEVNWNIFVAPYFREIHSLLSQKEKEIELKYVAKLSNAEQREIVLKAEIAQTKSQTLDQILEVVEDLRPTKPYPNFSNGYNNELDEEDKIIEKALSDIKEGIEKLR